ncbi:hypothetical protein AB8A05_04175 [Tardiphaga sp. 538_B7_N1_4]|uniref:hypothetical protein n=1 Tax=Tardiphaga sp. 538_B7_N1_4 TaxID=3240778 RepID=UPI003F1FADCF
MSDEAGTAGGEPVTVVTLAADAPASFSSVAEASRHLTEARKPKQDTPSETNDKARALMAQPADAPELVDETNAEPAEEQPIGEATEGSEPAEELPPIERPRSWTKDVDDDWKALPRTVQEKIASREQEREVAIRRSQNEAADKLKGLTAKEQEVEAARQKYEAQLPALMQALYSVQANTFSDIKTMEDVKNLQRTDPFRYQEWDVHQKELAAVSYQTKEAEDRQLREKQSKRANYETEQNKLLIELVPEMADPKKASELRERAVAMLTDDLGLKNDQLSRWMNDDTGHEILSNAGIQKLIADGLKYRDIKSAPKAIADKPLPPVQRPGVRPPANAGTEKTIQALTSQLDKASGLQAIRLAAELTAAKRKAGAR